MHKIYSDLFDLWMTIMFFYSWWMIGLLHNHSTQNVLRFFYSWWIWWKIWMLNPSWLIRSLTMPPTTHATGKTRFTALRWVVFCPQIPFFPMQTKTTNKGPRFHVKPRPVFFSFQPLSLTYLFRSILYLGPQKTLQCMLFLCRSL